MERIPTGVGVLDINTILAAETSACEFAKWGSEIRENHDLQTHLKRKRDFTDNLSRIWMINSEGRYKVSFIFAMWVYSSSSFTFFTLLLITLEGFQVMKYIGKYIFLLGRDPVNKFLISTCFRFLVFKCCLVFLKKKNTIVHCQKKKSAVAKSILFFG